MNSASGDWGGHGLGGYILAPAQQLQADVPIENIMALIDVAKNG